MKRRYALTIGARFYCKAIYVQQLALHTQHERFLLLNLPHQLFLMTYTANLSDRILSSLSHSLRDIVPTVKFFAGYLIHRTTHYLA